MAVAALLLLVGAIFAGSEAVIQLQGDDDWSAVEAEEDRLMERLVAHHRSVDLPSAAQATARLREDFPVVEEDPYEYSWRNKETRIQDFFRMLTARRQEGLELGIPPPRHRPYKPFGFSPPEANPASSFAFSPPQNSPKSSFAVPPSDERFYQSQNTLYGDKVLDTVDYGQGESTTLTNAQVVTSQAADSLTAEFQADEASSPQVFKTPLIDFNATKEDIIFVAVVAGSSAAVVVGVALLGYGWYRLHKSSKAAADVEYPAYGVTGPTGCSGGGGGGGGGGATPTSAADRRLAHSAQMYHYQLTKQQIIAMESNRGGGERRGSLSEADSDDENEEGDYTVYECPGLAPTGEMEVKNPLFDDDPTPGLGATETTASAATASSATTTINQNK